MELQKIGSIGNIYVGKMILQILRNKKGTKTLLAVHFYPTFSDVFIFFKERNIILVWSQFVNPSETSIINN